MFGFIKKNDVKKGYFSPPSISEHLPWEDFNDNLNLMALEDGRSVGCGFEILGLPMDSRSDELVEKTAKAFESMIADLLPREDSDPWVCQWFFSFDENLDPLKDRLNDFIECEDNLALEYKKIINEHLDIISSGMFVDPISDNLFRGRLPRIKLLIYRRYNKDKIKPDSVSELLDVRDKVESKLKQCGLAFFQLSGRHFYAWLYRWFNLKSPSFDVLNYKEEKPYGWSLSQNAFNCDIEIKKNHWHFGGVPHGVMVVKELNTQLKPGILNREMPHGAGDQRYAIIDKLPENVVYTIQCIYETKRTLESHLRDQEKSAFGSGGLAPQIEENFKIAKFNLEDNNLIMRSVEGFFYSGKNTKDIENKIVSALYEANIGVYTASNQVFPTDNFLRLLPFNYNYEFDKENTAFSNYKYPSDIAGLVPLYGRFVGCGNPLNIYFNRGGQPVIFDQTSKAFKENNSHMFILGTSGAGKSVLINNMIAALSATSNPRLVVLETGGSFDLMALYLKKHGRNVKIIKFDRSSPQAVNPYAEAYKALDRITIEEGGAYGESSSDEAERDILSEMTIATLIMVTRGNKEEEKKLTPTDISIVNNLLIKAIKHCKMSNKKQMILSDLIEVMSKEASKETNTKIREKIEEFVLRLEYYTMGIRGRFINQVSDNLNDFDFLHIDFGFLKDSSNIDLLNIVSVSYLSKILAIAERGQSSNRPIHCFIDEAHIFLKSKGVSEFIVLMSKVSRKYGLWLIPATQNIHDFEGQSKKVLAMIETWVCLSLSASEIQEASKIRTISPQAVSMIESIKPQKGVFSEAVLLSSKYSGIFRIIPPRIILALSMTEQSEKAHRKMIMIENCLEDEVEAASFVAGEMIKCVDKSKTKSISRQFLGVDID